MTRSQIQNLAALIFTGIIAVNANAAPVSADQLSAQKAVAKVIKNPEEAKFGGYSSPFKSLRTFAVEMIDASASISY